jgi:hypothetical protein
LKLRLRRPPAGIAIHSAVVLLDGKRVKTVRGKALRRPIALRHVRRGRLRIKVVLRLSGGRRMSETKRYPRCHR